MAEILKRTIYPNKPIVGLTICYSYLWHREYVDSFREEGFKDRPCVVVLSHQSIRGLPGRFVADVVPITHSRRSDGDAVEIPLSVKERMGLDTEHSWIITTEINRFIWPGFDRRPVKQAGDQKETYWHWGIMATDIFNNAKERVLARRANSSLLIVPRSGR